LGSLPAVFFFGGAGRNFAKFPPEKYDFDLYTKDFSKKIYGPNSPDFKDLKKSKSPDFYEKFQ
jgi:hypothetical protein